MLDGIPAGKLTPRRTTAALQPHQKHSIAMGLVQGMPIGEIATLVRHTPAYVKRCVEQDREINDLYEHYSSVVMRSMVQHRIKLMEMLPQAYQAIEDGLIDQDIKNRMAAADKVFKEVKPGLGVDQGPPGVDIHISSAPDSETQKILSNAVEGITELLTEIKNLDEPIKPASTFIRDTLPGPEDVVGHDTRDDSES